MKPTQESLTALAVPEEQVLCLAPRQPRAHLLEVEAGVHHPGDAVGADLPGQRQVHVGIVGAADAGDQNLAVGVEAAQDDHRSEPGCGAGSFGVTVGQVSLECAVRNGDGVAVVADGGLAALDLGGVLAGIAREGDTFREGGNGSQGQGQGWNDDVSEKGHEDSLLLFAGNLKIRLFP